MTHHLPVGVDATTPDPVTLGLRADKPDALRDSGSDVGAVETSPGADAARGLVESARARAYARTAEAEADTAIRRVLRLHALGHAGIVVLAPPGAGKSELVAMVAAQACGRLRERCLIATVTNEQAQALARRITRLYARIPVTLLVRRDLPLPDDIAQHPRIRVVHDAARLPAGPAVVIANVFKLRECPLPVASCDTLIVDEAYQVADFLFLPVSALARRVVLVGDPGQIQPVIDCELDRWRDDEAGPHVPAPQALLARRPELPTVRLPVSRRLVADTVRLVQPAFYPDLPFLSATADGDRALAFPRLAASAAEDEVLARLEWGTSIVLAELPTASHVSNDPAIASTLIRVAERVLARGGVVETTDGARTLSADDIGIVCAERDQVRAVQERLPDSLVGRVLVESANRFQGLERDVMLVWHPMSSRSAATPFHLDIGRFCVMLTRHRVAAVVVSRAGISATVDRVGPFAPPPISASTDETYRGVLAHRALARELERHDRRVALPGLSPVVL